MMKSLNILALGLVAALLTSCGGNGNVRRVEGGVWNTVYHITYTSDKDLDDSILVVLDSVGRSLSVFDDASLVCRVNRSPSATVVADGYMKRVVEASRRVGQASCGAFDPTVGPLVELWGFGRDKTPRTPSQAEIDAALLSVGIDSCGIDSLGRVVKKHDDTSFNFSAIAKGLGVDAVAEMFVRNGVSDFMVEIGGEVRVAGQNPRGRPWRIMVDAPVESADSVVHEELAYVQLTKGAIATSGNYRNYRATPGGGHIGHTISSLTGRPVQSAMLSASVVASDCMTADAFATACMAMQPEAALRMIRTMQGVEALIVYCGAEGEPKMAATPGFPISR